MEVSINFVLLIFKQEKSKYSYFGNYHESQVLWTGRASWSNSTSTQMTHHKDSVRLYSQAHLPRAPNHTGA
jgi:hypothetical protein